MKKFIVLLLAAVMALATVTAYANPSVTEIETEVVEAEATIEIAPDTPQETIDKISDIMAKLADEKDETTVIKVEAIDPDKYLDKIKEGADEDDKKEMAEKGLTYEDIAEVVTTVNSKDPEDRMTVVEAADKLKAANKDEEGKETYTVYKTNEDGEQEAVEVSKEEMGLENYSFVTGFADLALQYEEEDGSTEVTYDLEGNPISAKVTMEPEFLKGMEKAEDIASYKIMLINPENGETVFIELTKDNVEIKEDGTVSLTVEFPFLGTFAFIQEAPATPAAPAPAGR